MHARASQRTPLPCCTHSFVLISIAHACIFVFVSRKQTNIISPFLCFLPKSFVPFQNCNACAQEGCVKSFISNKTNRKNTQTSNTTALKIVIYARAIAILSGFIWGPDSIGSLERMRGRTECCSVRYFVKMACSAGRTLPLDPGQG